jgi:hypothetical protein
VVTNGAVVVGGTVVVVEVDAALVLDTELAGEVLPGVVVPGTVDDALPPGSVGTAAFELLQATRAVTRPSVRARAAPAWRARRAAEFELMILTALRVEGRGTSQSLAG